MYDIYDYAEHGGLKEQARKFLDLVWLEWAQDQLSGRRGGAKTRRYDWHGPLDSMYAMALFLLGGPGDAGHAYYNFIVSEYRLPSAVWKLALDRESLGSFAYISRKPGEEPNVWPRPPGTERSLMCDAESRFVRYSWVTPSYIMGTQMDHPAAVHSHLSMTDRWQGVIFDTRPEAAVYPSGVDLSEAEWKMKAIAYRSVQHRNIMITQQNRGWTQVDPEWFPTRNRDSLPYGVYFGKPEHTEERAGWIFVREGEAYLAVRIVCGAYRWNKRRTIVVSEDRFSPIVFHASSRAECDGWDEFLSAILENPIRCIDTVVPGWKLLEYTDRSGDGTCLSFNAANHEIPMIDGRSLEYAPDFTFYSPYLRSTYGSGIVTVSVADESFTLDFNE